MSDTELLNSDPGYLRLGDIIKHQSHEIFLWQLQEGLPTKTKDAPSPHEVRLTLLDINPVFRSLIDNYSNKITRRVA